MASGDSTLLADSEVLPHEKPATAFGFLIRAVAWFARQGIKCWRVRSDSASTYRSIPWLQALEALALMSR